MPLRPFYPGLFVALFLSSSVASAPVPTVQHDEASRGERDAVAVAAADVGSRGSECRVSADCVSDPLRPICDEAPCVGCQNDAQCAAERPGTTKCALTEEPGAEIGQCLPCSPYATCSTDPIQWYVDPVNGQDTNPGTRAKPFRTLAKAMPLVGPGHTLNLRGNAFYPPTAFSFSGTREKPITVQAYIEPYAVFDGGYPELREEPNDAWEQVPGGHPEEWRTKTVYTPLNLSRNPDDIYWGEIMGRKVRLLAYTALEDLRADNESRAIVPLSDPRPAGGPLVVDETKKIPWCYYGPGLTWVLLNPSDPTAGGHIHVRLSHTHVNAPGFEDYAGETNPNKLALSISQNSSRVATISSNHVIFKNLVFQNGGEETVKINGSETTAHNLVFDHVQFIGGRHVVRMADTTGVRFLHSTFDGGLAPWTGRHETKESYRYYKTYLGPGHPGNVRGSNGLARQTNTILLITGGGTHLEIAYSTFRRAHDAISVSGLNTQIHHSLFEDINDEALQFGGTETDTDNVRVYENMLRHTLNPLSFALRKAGGRVYIYRNVIDMRVPTRGYHTLPPDAPAPWLWRYGLDFKMNSDEDGDGGIHPFFAYHNTFITSHNSNQTTSAVFSNMRNNERWYYNNVHVMMNVGEPMMWIPNPELPAHAGGNVYYNYTPGYAGPYWRYGPYSGFPDGGVIADMAALFAHDIFQKYRAANDEGFEVGSQIADPRFANFTRQTFDHQVPYPNNDFRPSTGSPLIGAGQVLPASWPDPYRPSGGAPPDVGALPFGAPPLKVGGDAASHFPKAGVPLAIAGNRQDVVDDDGDGFASVRVDADASDDLDGTIVDYEWRADGRLLSRQVSDTLYLPAKRNVIELRVRDNEGHEDTDAIEVVITPPKRHSENLLDSPGFEPSWLGTRQWQLPAEGLIMANNPHTGALALELTGAAAEGLVEQTVGVVPEATYEVSAWIETAATTLGAKLQYRMRSATGADLGLNTVANVIGTNAYAHYRRRFVAPANAATLTVRLHLPAGDSGRAFFDDVRLISNNRLIDASFELRAKDGTRSLGWQFVRGGAFAEVTHAHSGRSALVLIGGVGYHLISQQVPVTAAKSYRVSGWVKAAQPTKASSVKIRFVNAAGKEIDSLREVETIPPHQTTPYRPVRDDQTFVAPATAEAMRVLIRLEGPGEGEPPATGSVFYDDMMVEEVEEQ